MGQYREIRPARVLMGRLFTDQDLFGGLQEICRAEGIKLGRIDAIGAVRKARIGYYDQHNREYTFKDFEAPLEITKLCGNISVRDGLPTVHAHVTLADADGHAFGGHLAPGTTVFACEFTIEAYEGPDYIRGFDETTGLPLWE